MRCLIFCLGMILSGCHLFQEYTFEQINTPQYFRGEEVMNISIDQARKNLKDYAFLENAYPMIRGWGPVIKMRHEDNKTVAWSRSAILVLNQNPDQKTITAKVHSLESNKEAILDWIKHDNLLKRQ